MLEKLQNKIAEKVITTAAKIVEKNQAEKAATEKMSRLIDSYRTPLYTIIGTHGKNIEESKRKEAYAEVDMLSTKLAQKTMEAETNLQTAEKARKEAEDQLRKAEVEFQERKNQLEKALTETK